MQKNLLPVLILLIFILLSFGCILPFGGNDQQGNGVPDENQPDDTGTIGPAGSEYGFSDALLAFAAIEQKYSEAKTPQEMEEFLTDISVFRQEQEPKLQGLPQLEALRSFADFKSKEAMAKKSFFSIAQDLSPQLLKSKSTQELQETKNSVSGVLEDFDTALSSINNFETNFQDFTGQANSGASKQSLQENKNELNQFLGTVQSFEDSLPHFIQTNAGSGTIDFEMATEIVVKEIVKGQDMLVFSSGEQIEEFTKVYQFGPPDEPSNFVWETIEPVWFFWVDKEPAARFAHPTSFVFVKENGEFIEFSASWWPVIRSQQLFYKDIVENKSDNLVFGEMNLSREIKASTAGEGTVFFQAAALPVNIPPRKPCPCNEPSEFYAIVIQGDSRADFGADTANIMGMLKRKNVKNDNANRHSATDNIEYVAPPANTNGDVDWDLSKANVQRAFDRIKQKIRCCDILFVYMSTHGGLKCEVTWENRITGSQSTETFWNEKCPNLGDTSWGLWKVVDIKMKTWWSFDGDPNGMYDTELDAMLDTIDSCNIYIYIDSCHAGASIDHMKGKGRTIGTSSSARDVAFGGPGNTGSASTSGLISGLDGTAGADADGDGKVSMDEAIKNTQQKFGQISNPQFWASTEACECPPKICNDLVSVGTGTIFIDVSILVDGNKTVSIDKTPGKDNHLIIESDAAFNLPLDLTIVSIDGTTIYSEYTISDLTTQCANPKKCSTDITTANLPDGTINLTVIDVSGNEGSKIIDILPLTVTCTENWSCTSWSACSNGTQTRTCTDSSNCGTTTVRPALSQSCQNCTENWSCGEWSAWGGWSSCPENGTQTRTRTRTCTDSSNCGTTASKPATTETESQNCTYTPTEQKPEYSAHETALGSNIANLSYSGATQAFNLSATGGTYGYRILEIPSHTTIKVCVSAETSLYLNYYPQYHYGFDFTDPSPGCTQIYNKNNWANGVLVHLGDPTPVNTSGQITITQQ